MNLVRAQLRTGTVEGLRLGTVQAFLGVPYAAPPLGANRWRGPRPVTPWSGVRQAQRFGPSCSQAVTPQGFGPWTAEYVVQGVVSEDCLYLNVWSPAEKTGAPCPVLMWIHGGAFAQGSGSVPIYNGQSLAAQGVVVVTINYRLGALGFLAHPDLAHECGASPDTNFGLQDQIAALQWVQANIAAFGGDPDAVTLAGQSAGALSVHMLMASPLAQGLFHRAIAQGGPPSMVPMPSRTQALEAGLAFAAELGCASVEELRSLPAHLLIGAPTATPRFWPMADGVLLPAWPPYSPGAVAAADVSMLVGQNTDENSALDPQYASGDAAVLTGLLSRYYGAMAGRFGAFYPSQDATACARSYSEACLDRWLSALWCWAEQRAAAARSPVYAYLFDHVEPGPDAARYGCFHTSEVPYALGTLAAAPDRPYTAIDRQVSASLSRYWINFIRFGNPNGAGDGPWPALDASTPLMMRIGQHSRPEPLLTRCKLSALRDHVVGGGSLQVL